MSGCGCRCRPVLNADTATVCAGLALRGGRLFDSAVFAASATVGCIGSLGCTRRALAPVAAALRAAAFWGGAAAYVAVLPLHSAFPQLPAADVHLLPMLLVLASLMPNPSHCLPGLLPAQQGPSIATLVVMREPSPCSLSVPSPFLGLT